MTINFLAEVEQPDEGDNIIRTKDTDVVPNPAGFGHELFTRMREHGEAVAQIDAETGQHDTFKELLQRCVRVALHLKKRGATTEDIVAPATGNHLNTAVAMIAPLLIGAKISCVDPCASHGDIETMLNITKPKVIMVCKEFEEKLETALKATDVESEIVVFGETEKNTPFSKLLEPVSIEEEESFEPYEAKDLEDTCVVVFSSGSTGLPKGIRMTHYSILCQVGSYAQFKKAQAVKTLTILFSGISWVTGQLILASHIVAGCPRLVCNNFTEEKTWRYLVKYKVVSLFLTTPHAISLMKYGNPDKVDTPTLRVIGIFGAKISAENMSTLRSHFTSPILTMNLYGISEVFGLVFSFKNLGAFLKKPETVGTPARGFQYKVVDPLTEKICGPNERGELFLKTKFYMKGYYNQDSTDCFDEDGFFKSGDMGYYDEEHCFFIVDRVREAIKYNNYWVSPTQLEGILLEHSAVNAACVIGLPCDLGHVIMAVVAKSEDAEHVTQDELVNFVNERVIENSRIRGGIIFVDQSEIPHTSTGKVRRFLLRKKIIEDLKDVDMNIFIN